jgi:hypothetical protein
VLGDAPGPDRKQTRCGTVYGARFERTLRVSTPLFEDCRRESQSPLGKSVLLRSVSRNSPSLKYRLPRMVRYPLPMRHVLEAVAILRLVRTRLRSRHP